MVGALPVVFLAIAMAVGVILAAFYRSMGARIAVIVLVVAIGAPLLYLLNLYYARELLQVFVQNVSDALGISSMLAKAIATLLIVPVLLALGLLFSVSRQKRLAGQILLSVGVASYWFALWFATSDHWVTAEGGQMKCYTLGPDGLHLFEKEQVDPRTGDKCRWIDRSDVPYIEAIDRKLRSGTPLKPITFRSMDEVKFFATGTNGAIPLVWYHRAGDNSYELYDAPGVHPVYGTPLTAVTPSVVGELIKWIKRELQRTQAEASAKKAAERQRHEAAFEREEARRRRLEVELEREEARRRRLEAELERQEAQRVRTPIQHKKFQPPIARRPAATGRFVGADGCLRESNGRIVPGFSLRCDKMPGG